MSDMRHRPLGASGLTVSVVGLGGNNFGRRIDLDATRAVVDAAIEAGVTLIDTADMYGDSEDFLGEALAGRREQVVLATKFGMPMHGRILPEPVPRGSRRYIRAAIASSLRRLRTDYIDLYQMHEPDLQTPIDETLDALTELVREGKVRYIGSSNFAGWQIAEAEHTARAAHQPRFISAQNHYNLLERGIEAEVVPAATHYGIGILPFFPLASGLLTGKYHRGAPAPAGSRLETRLASIDDRRFELVEALGKFAESRGVTLLEVAIGGLAAQPGVASVIAGATLPEQVRSNVAAGRWVPTAEDLAALDEITKPV